MGLVIRQGELRGILNAVVFIVGVFLAWLAFEKYTDTGAEFDAAGRYNVTIDHVDYYAARPHDCDFMTAPIGSKNCHYVRQFLAEWGLRSEDGGQTHLLVYGTVQDQPPEQCSDKQLDFVHRCVYEPLKAGDPPPKAGWNARRVEIHWRKVDD